MSKGTQIITLRIPPVELQAMDAAIERTALTRFEGKHTRTSWILSAIREKIAHQTRSKRKKKPKSEQHQQ